MGGCGPVPRVHPVPRRGAIVPPVAVTRQRFSAGCTDELQRERVAWGSSGAQVTARSALMRPLAHAPSEVPQVYWSPLQRLELIWGRGLGSTWNPDINATPIGTNLFSFVGNDLMPSFRIVNAVPCYSPLALFVILSKFTIT